MSFDEKLQQVLERVDELSSRMASETFDADDFANLSREYSELEPVAEAVRALMARKEELAGLSEILNDPVSDKEMRDLAGDGAVGACDADNGCGARRADCAPAQRCRRRTERYS